MAWFRLLHPFPSMLVTLASALFAELATGGHAPADRLVRLVLSVACSQGAIGSANDVIDRQLDAATKPWKPLARGAMQPRAATRLAVALSLACLALSASLGVAALLAACVGLGCGIAYDLRLKRTGWSWLPYGLAIPTLPLWSWTAMERFTGRLLLVYPLGLLLGLALHLANTLPDLEGDRAFGVRGFSHALGLRRSLYLCWGTMLLTQVLTLALAPLLRYRGWAYPAGLLISLALTVTAAGLYRLRPTARTLQINFGVLALAALSLALGWLAGALT
jgi:4-hydroxybenzoate polyprenyltransferase